MNSRDLTSSRWLGDAFLAALAVLLLGYATLGRGFASLGVGPLYVGEMTLLLGLGFLLATRRTVLLRTIKLLWPVLPFMAWGALRTLPFVGTYGIDALRDAVLWGYALFAFAIAAAAVEVPRRFARLLRWYRAFAVIFLVAAPLILVAEKAVGGRLPDMPGTGRPLLDSKGGDRGVHTAGIFAYAALVGPVPGAAVLVPVNAALNVTGRAAMMTMLAGFGLVAALRPRAPVLWRVALLSAVVLLGMFATAFQWSAGGGEGRQISADQIVDNLASVVGLGGTDDAAEADLNGTKQWRLKWWTKIVGYTVHGPYRWGGKGFGINLATEDGFQVNEDLSLRSPHNASMTVLARSGVVGLALWVGMLAWWFASVGRSWWAARRAGHARWAGVLAFTFTYGVAFLVNASFDVFLEGPMGGIWFWTLLGVGIAACDLRRRCPDLLAEVALSRRFRQRIRRRTGAIARKPHHLAAPLAGRV